MPLRLNHLQEKAGVNVQNVTDTLHFLVQEGCIPQDQLVSFQIELDWIQYKNNFREPVLLAETHNGQAGGAPVSELRIDTRKWNPCSLPPNPARLLPLQLAIDRLPPARRFQILPRQRSLWIFNRLYWNHFSEWERWTGRGDERALPGGASDAHYATSIADGVADFWTLLRELDKTGDLPQEIYYLEIGVGTGVRCGLWLDQFQALDRQRGTNYYPRLRVLLETTRSSRWTNPAPPFRNTSTCAASWSSTPASPSRPSASCATKSCTSTPPTSTTISPTKNTSAPTETLFSRIPRVSSSRRHAAHRRTVPNPRREVPRQRLTPCSAAARIIPRLRPRYGLRAGSVEPMRLKIVWSTSKPCRIRPSPPASTSPYSKTFSPPPPAISVFTSALGLCKVSCKPCRCCIPKATCKCRIFSSAISRNYQKAFRGPGKMDGSIVNWVNGALLKGVGEHSGYDVYFAPFHYRKASHTSIMYASRRN